jgi:hypothetical protein
VSRGAARWTDTSSNQGRFLEWVQVDRVPQTDRFLGIASAFVGGFSVLSAGERTTIKEHDRVTDDAKRDACHFSMKLV